MSSIEEQGHLAHNRKAADTDIKKPKDVNCVSQGKFDSESTASVGKAICETSDMSDKESVQGQDESSRSQSKEDDIPPEVPDTGDSSSHSNPSASEPSGASWASGSSVDSGGFDTVMEDLANLQATIDIMIGDPDPLGEEEEDDEFNIENWDYDGVDIADRLAGEMPAPLYPMGPLKYVDCVICFEKKDLNLRTCCTAAVCDVCVLFYLHIQVEQGIVKIECPSNQCDQYVHRDEVMTRLTGEIKEKYYRFLTDANKEAHVKTCPRCSVITKIDPSKLRDHSVKKNGLRHRCEDCELVWCFPCQAPWHEGISCKSFTKGDKMVKKWAKEQHRGQVNAQKCPKCKILIQRSSGCDHMTCNRCNVHFCYRCGERHVKVKFLGDHYSRLSIFGCKYKFMPDKPVRRKLIRGSIFALKTILAPVVAACALGVCACCLGLAVFVLPFWGIHKLRKRAKQKKARREERVYREMWRQRLQEIRVAGDPYIANFNRMRELGHNPFSNPGRSAPGNQGTLLVDELDMRNMNSTLSSSSTSNASDNQSIRSLSDDHIRFIQLNVGNLDIHHHHHHHQTTVPVDLELSGGNRSQADFLSSGVVLRAEDLLTTATTNKTENSGISDRKSKSSGSKIKGKMQRGGSGNDVEDDIDDMKAASAVSSVEMTMLKDGRTNVSGGLKKKNNPRSVEELVTSVYGCSGCDSQSKCDSEGRGTEPVAERQASKKAKSMERSEETVSTTTSASSPREDSSEKRSVKVLLSGRDASTEERTTPPLSEVVEDVLTTNKEMKTTKKESPKEKDVIIVMSSNTTTGKVVPQKGDSKVKRLVSQYSCSLRSNNSGKDEKDEDFLEEIDLVEEYLNNSSTSINGMSQFNISSALV